MGMNINDLWGKIEKEAKRQGIMDIGVADLEEAKDYIYEIFGEELLDYDRAISFLLPYPKRVVDQLEDGPTRTYLYYYDVLNRTLDHLALWVAIQLEAKGYHAFPIPASQRVTEDRLAGIFSHRLAANLAGIGWIGKNSSLIHPVYGPRCRLVTILTDAPFTPGEKMEERCGSCHACVEACPAQAITGKTFSTDDPLEERFIAKRCDDYLSKVRSAFGKRICGRCLAACPYGKEIFNGKKS